jgi:hypothetical protein
MKLTPEMINKRLPTRVALKSWLARQGVQMKALKDDLGCQIIETMDGAKLEAITPEAMYEFDRLLNGEVVTDLGSNAELVVLTPDMVPTGDLIPCVPVPSNVVALRPAPEPVTETEAMAAATVADTYIAQTPAVTEAILSDWDSRQPTAGTVAAEANTVLRFAADACTAYDAAKLIAKRLGVTVVMDRFDGSDLLVIQPNGNGKPAGEKRERGNGQPRINAPGKAEQVLIDLGGRPEGVTCEQFTKAANWNHVPSMSHHCKLIARRWGYDWGKVEGSRPVAYRLWKAEGR